MQTCSTEISIICVQKRALGGVWRGAENFHFLGLEMRILVDSSANLSIRVSAVIHVRPTSALLSVKKDRNDVPVVKKRTGTAFRCVPVPNEPWLKCSEITK